MGFRPSAGSIGTDKSTAELIVEPAAPEGYSGLMRRDAPSASPPPAATVTPDRAAAVPRWLRPTGTVAPGTTEGPSAPLPTREPPPRFPRAPAPRRPVGPNVEFTDAEPLPMFTLIDTGPSEPSLAPPDAAASAASCAKMLGSTTARSNASSSL